MITVVKPLDVVRHDEKGLKKDTVLNTNSLVEDVERKCRENFRKNRIKRQVARKKY